jgi:hypothetical protein
MDAPETLLLLPFDEDVDHFLVKDRLGNLAPLAGATVLPTVADGLTGRARSFTTATHGLTGVDATAGDTLTTRDATVQAIVTIESIASGAFPRTLYCRGSDIPSDRYSLCVELTKITSFATTLIGIRMRWQDGPGTNYVQPVATFVPPTEGTWIMLTATRRWISTTRVVCRYYVNGDLLGEHESDDGEIGGATTGTTTVGVRETGGILDWRWIGKIDGLKVTNYEMCAEEVRATWDRITRHQQLGVDALAARVPPGANWAEPETNWGRLLRIAGAGLGYAWAKVEELRENFLPDRCYQGDVERWERLNAIPTEPIDSHDTRRARVVAFMSRDNGYAIEQIQERLAEPLEVSTANVEIIELENRIEDSFDTLEAERWHAEPAGAWTIVGGELRVERSLGEDARWDDENRNPYRCITPLSSGEGEVVLLAKIDSWSVSSDTVVGLQLFNWRTGNGLWLGVRGGGVDYFGYVSFVDGVQSAFTELDSPVAAPLWARIIKDPDVAGRYRLGYSTTGPTTGFVESTVSGLLSDAEWAGFGLLGLDASGATDDFGQFDDAVVITPEGTRPFCWYAYRDPGLAGTADLLLANALIRKYRPAHTHGAAIVSRSLLCDTATSGCDLGPMGAL